uniref:16S rRNA (guanine(1405)-N(7))-methyltransferase n=1 Tax=Streptoalloteichus tenebrarius (strain ATCC 17920 / DSM 40477 / JCM 4838 / CBS 697.72 / NBRC 16177 / NCIMB 11028 / NRRL B-12390 / A12253. 1 / ISP 5477) TaxID=1933 RepID=Q53316_STRSD|nr:S-adenosyl methionine-dependent methylase [Streptoalloteichus tenebrarius]
MPHPAPGPGDPEDPRLAEVVDAVRSSRRYQSVAPETVRRLATSALVASRGDLAEAVKRTKRGLHEIFGAYLPSPPKYDALLRQLRGAVDAATTRPCGHPAPRHVHARLHPRALPILDEFYREVFARCADPASVRDLACGMNPLAAPWMPGSDAFTYHASDIDTRLMEFLDAALETLGVAHDVRVRDLMTGVGEVETDVTLLLKTVPCIEAQGRGQGWDLIDAIRSPLVVVSFPTKSLGQRSKGMFNTYSANFDAWLENRPHDVEQLEFRNELVYFVRKNA